ncbi:MAG: PadR family transcriptional regulator [Erysipelothrix sp.]|nr:PadR family transcriptional regulator [Erysipelothrix sp.]
MATQLKKGTFEICLLALLSNKDSYGYELVGQLNEIIEVKESTIYLILQRLERSKQLESYVTVVEGTAKARKYYRITQSGKVYYEMLLSEWDNLEKLIQKCIQKGAQND